MVMCNDVRDGYAYMIDETQLTHYQLQIKVIQTQQPTTTSRHNNDNTHNNDKSSMIAYYQRGRVCAVSVRPSGIADNQRHPAVGFMKGALSPLSVVADAEAVVGGKDDGRGGRGAKQVQS